MNIGSKSNVLNKQADAGSFGLLSMIDQIWCDVGIKRMVVVIVLADAESLDIVGCWVGFWVWVGGGATYAHIYI